MTSATSVPLALDTSTHGTAHSIVLERLLNELGIADLSTFEAVLMHDTGAVLDAIRSTAAAAEAGAAAYASSATSNVVVSPSSTATAVSTDAQTAPKGSDIHAAASSASAEMLSGGWSSRRSCGHRPRSSLLSSALRAL